MGGPALVGACTACSRHNKGSLGCMPPWGPAGAMHEPTSVSLFILSAASTLRPNSG